MSARVARADTVRKAGSTVRLRSDELFTTEVDGQTVVLDSRSSNYLTTNAAGSLMLETLAEDVTAADLVTALQARYGIDTATAERDSGAFLAQLRQHGFLEE